MKYTIENKDFCRFCDINTGDAFINLQDKKLYVKTEYIIDNEGDAYNCVAVDDGKMIIFDGSNFVKKVAELVAIVS